MVPFFPSRGFPSNVDGSGRGNTRKPSTCLVVVDNFPFCLIEDIDGDRQKHPAPAAEARDNLPTDYRECLTSGSNMFCVVKSYTTFIAFTVDVSLYVQSNHHLKCCIPLIQW